MNNRYLTSYHPGKPGLEKVLGSLESEIMEIVWQKGCDLSVRDVLDALRPKRNLAYTTVMTIMGRLSEKKLLLKYKVGNAYYFKPALSRGDFTGQIVGGMIDDLLADFSDAALSHFMKRVEKTDRSVLEKLEKTLESLKEQDDDSTV